MRDDLEKKFAIDTVTAMEDDIKQKNITLEKLQRDSKVQADIVAHKDKQIKDMNKFEQNQEQLD